MKPSRFLIVQAVVEVVPTPIVGRVLFEFRMVDEQGAAYHTQMAARNNYHDGIVTAIGRMGPVRPPHKPKPEATPDGAAGEAPAGPSQESDT
jgi:hypothetical protein